MKNGFSSKCFLILFSSIHKAGITKPILCMGYTDTAKIQHAIDSNIRITVYSLEMAMKIDELAKLSNKKAYVHIKLDTGMSRIGFLVNEQSISDIKKMFTLENLIIEGIYTSSVALM